MDFKKDIVFTAAVVAAGVIALNGFLRRRPGSTFRGLENVIPA